jgi:hypothetical protein
MWLPVEQKEEKTGRLGPQRAVDRVLELWAVLREMLDAVVEVMPDLGSCVIGCHVWSNFPSQPLSARRFGAPVCSAPRSARSSSRWTKSRMRARTWRSSGLASEHLQCYSLLHLFLVFYPDI